MTLIKPGKYNAKVKDHAIGETKGGAPQAIIRFEFVADGTDRELAWYGYFTDKTVERTIKALVICGLDGASASGPLEIGREVSITVDIDQDLSGNDRNVIRWVNALGDTGTAKSMPQSEAKAKLARFDGLVMSTKAAMPQQHSKRRDEDNIPF